MIEAYLGLINNSSDYITAMRLFQKEHSLTKSDVNALRPVYMKYVPGADDQTYADACLMVDLVSNNADRDCLKAIGLTDSDIEGIYAAKHILEQVRFNKATEEAVNHIVSVVSDESVKLYIRIILARTTLNTVTHSKDMMNIIEQVNVLANFIVDCGTEELDKFANLIPELRLGVRNETPKEEQGEG